LRVRREIAAAMACPVRTRSGFTHTLRARTKGPASPRPFASRNLQEQAMTDNVVARIRANPKYQELKRKRSSFGWWLTALMMVVYYGYIALIAWNKEFLSQPLGTGVTTIGVPIGMGVIIFTIVITGIYVRRANSEFDSLTQQILEEEVK
jgi:uncharacterized membrane protein (DUF485 family)